MTAFAQSDNEIIQDIKQIEHVLMLQWDKKESPLSVPLVVIEGEHAIAGWLQGERGGRALLRRGQQGWEVYMCGGDDLTNRNVLEQAGIEASTAQLLATKLKTAEQGMSPGTRKQLSIFEGFMAVKANHLHAH